uniref:Uncharacterized protein n=1 Tax=Callorhinchus milii TaxID=7868 RepID=A0A4W3H3S1_CALMI
MEINYSTNKIRCLIRSKLLRDEQEGNLQISDEFFPKVPVDVVVSSVFLGLAILVLSVLVGYSVKQRREIKALQLRLVRRKLTHCAGKSLSNQRT